MRCEVGAAWLFQPPVLDIAEEARPEEGVGLLDVGEIRRQERSLDLKCTILVDGSELSLLADDKEFVAITDNLKTVVWVCGVDPPAEKLRSRGSAAVKKHDAE